MFCTEAREFVIQKMFCTEAHNMRLILWASVENNILNIILFQKQRHMTLQEGGWAVKYILRS